MNLSRIMLDRMSKSIGQPFIVDNRPGAGGKILGVIGDAIEEQKVHYV